MTAFYKYAVAEISNGIKQKQFSARDVIESALSRLDSVNPSINAVIDTYHGDALANADRIDHCIARDESLGDLAGVPVTIKVNIDQAGKINTNGLLIQKDHLAEIDNPVVNNLKKAGAIIIGTTNTPAFSMRWFTNNRAHGHTRSAILLMPVAYMAYAPRQDEFQQLIFRFLIDISVLNLRQCRGQSRVR